MQAHFDQRIQDEMAKEKQGIDREMEAFKQDIQQEMEAKEKRITELETEIELI